MGSLQKQGKIYTYQTYIDGKKYRRTTGTGDLRLAKLKGREIEKQLCRAESLSEFEATKKVKRFPTIKECISIYLETAEKRELAGMKPRLSTAKRNAQDLENLVGSDAKTTDLTTNNLDAFASKRLQGKKGVDIQRTRNSIDALHRRGRSLFSDWAIKSYEDAGHILPDVIRWRKYRCVKVDHGSYRVPIEEPELVERTLKHGRQLVAQQHHLAVAWLLNYELALRANEIKNLQWNWFVKRGEHYALLVIDRPELEFSCKGTNREIQVHRKLYEKLKELRGSFEFICPGPTSNSRNNYITRDLANWVRLMGFDVKRFPKAGYELRKLKGSEWFSKLGPQIAQEWLGHKSIETTMQYYACLIIDQDPPEPIF